MQELDYFHAMQIGWCQSCGNDNHALPKESEADTAKDDPMVSWKHDFAKWPLSLCYLKWMDGKSTGHSSSWITNLQRQQHIYWG